MKNWTNFLALVLILLSFGLLFPGVSLPVLTIKGAISLPLVGKMELGQETRSIWGTIQYLFETKNTLVGFLILCFSVVVPIVKGLLLLLILFPVSYGFRINTLKVIRRIGKWSMADVFVVAVFLAYLATASMEVFQATLERGFYFFLGYCILSVASTEFILIKEKPRNKK